MDYDFCIFNKEKKNYDEEGNWFWLMEIDYVLHEEGRESILLDSNGWESFPPLSYCMGSLYCLWNWFCFVQINYCKSVWGMSVFSKENDILTIKFENILTHLTCQFLQEFFFFEVVELENLTLKNEN